MISRLCTRGADLLLARKDVDARRLAYVSHGHNATVGGLLAGIDKRFTTFVLMTGTLSEEVDSNTQLYKDYRQKVGPEKLDAFMAKYAWLDPGKYVSHAAPVSVFMQYSTQERDLTVEWARQYEAIVSQPRQFKTYDALHALNAAARRDRIAFLTKQLKLKPLSPAVIAAVPDLV